MEGIALTKGKSKGARGTDLKKQIAPARDLFAEIWGKWPGDESVEEILEALRSGKDIKRKGKP